MFRLFDNIAPHVLLQHLNSTENHRMCMWKSHLLTAPRNMVKYITYIEIHLLLSLPSVGSAETLTGRSLPTLVFEEGRTQ